MLKFNTWRINKSLTLDNFWLPLFLFGVLFNFILFQTFSYLENEVLGRTLIWTYIGYASLYAALHQYIFGINIFIFLKVALALFLIGFAFVILSLLSINTGSLTLMFIITIVAYTALMTLLLTKQFKAYPSIRLLTEITVLSSLSIYVSTLLGSIPSHEYGLQFMLSLWMLTTTYIVLVHHSTYTEGTKSLSN